MTKKILGLLQPIAIGVVCFLVCGIALLFVVIPEKSLARAVSPSPDWLLIRTNGVTGTPAQCWELPSTDVEVRGQHYIWTFPPYEHQIYLPVANTIAVEIDDGNWDEAYDSLRMSRRTCMFLSE